MVSNKTRGECAIVRQVGESMELFATIFFAQLNRFDLNRAGEIRRNLNSRWPTVRCWRPAALIFEMTRTGLLNSGQ